MCRFSSGVRVRLNLSGWKRRASRQQYPPVPTLPLFDPSADDSAWHRVTAPGGFEWWHFDMTDAGRNLRVSIDFVDGNPFDRDYQKAYTRYIARPTRVAPPTPSDYPCVRVGVFQNNRLWWGGNAGFPAGSFNGSANGPEISIGASGVRKGETAGELQVSIDRLPPADDGSLIAMSLRFRPVSAFTSRLQRFDDAPTLVRFLQSDRYDVAGELRLDSGDATTENPADDATTPFAGVGRHDHLWATRPMTELRGDWIARMRASDAAKV
jgi:hypothetical protein